MTMTANPAGKRKSNQCDWGRMKRTKGQGGNDSVESRKKKKKKLYSWGGRAWGTRWQQQPCGTGWQLQGGRCRQEAVERELGIKGYSCNEQRSEKTENEDTTEEGATGGVPVKKNPIIQFYFYHRILFFIMVLIMFAFFFFPFQHWWKNTTLFTLHSPSPTYTKISTDIRQIWRKIYGIKCPFFLDYNFDLNILW